MTRPDKQRTEGLIFDIDGTLVDSNDLHARAWSEAFERFDKPIPYDVIRSQIGKGGDLLVPDLLDAREMRRFGDELRDYRKKLFQERYIDLVQPFPDASETLRLLHNRGIRLVLASSSDADEVKHYIELLGAKKFLDGSTSKKDAEYSKPYPEIFEAALEEIGSRAERTAVVGDTPYDILAAHRVALPIIAVRSGGFPDAALQKAEFLFDGVGELPGRMQEIDDYFAAE